MDVIRAVAAAISEHGLIEAGQTVLVGVSGGPDSLCLLHALRALQHQRLPGVPQFGLHAAHLNHGLRGAESRADADFVAGLAREWGLPATVEAAGVRKAAEASRLSLEEAGRQARYAFLAEAAGRAGAERVAVAHNADDQAETVLMHFLRGSGVAGLRGMLYKAQIPISKHQDPKSKTQRPNPKSQGPKTKLRLIRPLLDVPRAEVEAYCAEHGLQPRFDHSNLDTTFFRNRLRHEVLPFLEQASPGLRVRLHRMAEVMAGEHATLQQVLESARALAVTGETEERITFDLGAFRALPGGLQRALLRDSAGRLRAGLRDIAFTPVDAAVRLAQEGAAGASASLPGGLALTLSYDSAVLAPAGAPPALPDMPLLQAGESVPVGVPGATPLPGTAWTLHAETGQWPLETAEQNDDPWQAYLDWGEPEALSLRARQSGDRFQPQGMGGAEPKLADFMIAQKVPRAWRDRLPLLVRGGDIVWVCGWRVSEAAAVREAARGMLRVWFEREEP